MGQARSIEPLQVLPVVLPLAMASKIGGDQHKILWQQGSQAEQIAPIEHGAVKEEGGAWAESMNLRNTKHLQQDESQNKS
jgi:hypothetical protein